MKTKIFGIGAVVLLVLVSFGPVVTSRVDQLFKEEKNEEPKDTTLDSEADKYGPSDVGTTDSDCPCRRTKNPVSSGGGGDRGDPPILDDGIYPIGNCPDGIYEATFVEPDLITFETDAEGGGRDEWTVTFSVPEGGSYPFDYPLTTEILIEVNGEFISSYSTEVYEDHATVTLVTLEDSFTGTFYGDENPWDNPELFALYLTVESYSHSVQDALSCVLSQFIPEIFISGDDVHVIGQPPGGRSATEDDCAEYCRDDHPKPDDCTGWWDAYKCCVIEANYDLCRRQCECYVKYGDDAGNPVGRLADCLDKAAALFVLDSLACVVKPWP